MYFSDHCIYGWFKLTKKNVERKRVGGRDHVFRKWSLQVQFEILLVVMTINRNGKTNGICTWLCSRIKHFKYLWGSHVCNNSLFISLHSWTLSCLRPQIAEWWSSADGAVNFCVVTYRVIHIGLVIFGDEVDKADVTCFAELVSSETKELVPFSPKLYSNPTHYRPFLLHRDNARCAFWVPYICAGEAT